MTEIAPDLVEETSEFSPLRQRMINTANAIRNFLAKAPWVEVVPITDEQRALSLIDRERELRQL